MDINQIFISRTIISLTFTVGVSQRHTNHLKSIRRFDQKLSMKGHCEFLS